MEVLEARTSNFTRLWKTDLDIRGPRREWTCFVQPSIQRPQFFLRCQYRPQRPRGGCSFRRLHKCHVKASLISLRLITPSSMSTSASADMELFLALGFPLDLG